MNAWLPPITKPICRRCSGRCCTDPHTHVVLDYEKAMRKLHQYRYVRSYVGLSSEIVPVLKKDRTGTCVYFDRKTGGCGIYDRRPLACQAWFCGRGTKNDLVWKMLRRRTVGRKTRLAKEQTARDRPTRLAEDGVGVCPSVAVRG